VAVYPVETLETRCTGTDAGNHLKLNMSDAWGLDLASVGRGREGNTLVVDDAQGSQLVQLFEY